MTVERFIHAIIFLVAMFENDRNNFVGFVRPMY